MQIEGWCIPHDLVIPVYISSPVSASAYSESVLVWVINSVSPTLVTGDSFMKRKDQE